MIDPLSVAGLTFAVVDTLIKLGERTSELIQDANAFESVSRLNSQYETVANQPLGLERTAKSG